MKNILARRKYKLRAVFLLVLFILLLSYGLVALSTLSGKAIRFDAAYDAGKDLSPFYFAPLEEGESYNALQNFWLFTVRHRLIPIFLAIICIAVFIMLNKELIYDQDIAPYVFVVPFILTFAIFFAYPLISTIKMSFQEITGAGTKWIGLKNYRDMFSNKNFYIAVKNSFIYMVLTCAILIPVPMVLAHMVNTKICRMATFFKVIAFMPVLCSVVVSGIIFRMMFSELDGSMMNGLRTIFGMKPIAWLKDRNGSMFAMVLLCFWRWTGMNMLYYLAGLQSIPADLYEAADIDGATPVQKFTRVTLPLLKPTTIYVLTISIYAGLAMFTESYMIFGGNNSPKNYGLTIVGYLYRYGFEKVDKFGFASAVGIVLMLGALIITVIQLWFTGVIGKNKED